MKKLGMLVLAAAVCTVLVGLSQTSWAAEDAKAEQKAGATACKGTQQTKCPIMGNPVNKDLYVDHEGRRIYVCCKGCIEKVKADPEAAIKKIIANGECPKFWLELCPKCGEVKGTKKCCAEGAEKCDKCSLQKGSPGCCLAAQDSTKPVLLCPKCGEVKGQDKCCAKAAAKCDKCGLNKDAPGCCKLDKSLMKNAKGACATCTTKPAGCKPGCAGCKAGTCGAKKAEHPKAEHPK